jgi:hypothetical protein
MFCQVFLSFFLSPWLSSLLFPEHAFLISAQGRSAKITAPKIPNRDSSYTSSSYSQLLRHGKRPLQSGYPEQQHLRSYHIISYGFP